MANQPYARFRQEEMILRDYLAADRTSLANERTLMSYVRTALAFFIGGASALHFLDSLATDVLGVILIALGTLTFAAGGWRYIWYRRRIATILARVTSTPEQSS